MPTKQIFKISENSSKFYKEDVHVIIKTKFNKDYKYININKSIVLSNLENETKVFKKIDRFQLEKSTFFQKLIQIKNSFQVLAKGNFYRPNKLSDICSNLKPILPVLLMIYLQKMLGNQNC